MEQQAENSPNEPEAINNTAISMPFRAKKKYGLLSAKNL